jgi:hypothetical protein
MIKNKNGKVILGIVMLSALFISPPPSVVAQGEGVTKKPDKIELEALKGGKNGEFDYKLGEWRLRNPKKPVIAGIPLGGKRSDIMGLFTSKQIAPLQRTSPMDSFPRLIGEISHIKKAYLLYTQDRLSKLTILFNVPIDPKDPTGEPLFEFYKELRKKLVHDYGQPTNSTAYVHPNFPYTLVAVETGNAFNLDYWENADDMKILLSLKGREGEIYFSLTYQYLPLFIGN